MSDLPDSIDIVILTHPEELVPFEREEIKILKDKGTKVAYAVSYDDIKAKYDEEQITASQIQMKENSENTFDGFLREEVKKQLAYSETFDGVIIKFNGKNPKYMTDEDRVSYEATQEVFFNTISEWEKENKNKFLSFQGKPQNIIKKEQLSRFLHIIIEFYQVTDVNKFSLTIQDCLEPGVPTDRFIMAVSTPSLDSSDTTTGYLGKELATIETAYWITSISSEYNKSGIAIDNVQNDYYQTNGTYRNVKEVINIMNPAPIK